jgi:hypothetical protein
MFPECATQGRVAAAVAAACRTLQTPAAANRTFVDQTFTDQTFAASSAGAGPNSVRTADISLGASEGLMEVRRSIWLLGCWYVFLLVLSCW